MHVGAELAGGGVSAHAADSAPAPGPAESLYLKLGSVGLDPARVSKVRDASLQRGALHISLDDGTIAFTEDAGGHITGAFFQGEGEVLLFPPNPTERASLALFTGAAILEEKFSTAYFRFNDDVPGEMQSALRPADNAAEFASLWNTTAHALAPEDALRLLLSFSRDLPPAEKPPATTTCCMPISRASSWEPSTCATTRCARSRLPSGSIA